MITLMVNLYDEEPGAAITSAVTALGELVSKTIVLEGRYEGFPDLDMGIAPVFASEHEKRNAMIEMAGAPVPGRWLLWIDCDERVTRASPLLGLQLERAGLLLASGGPMVGIRFVDPLPPDPELLPGLVDPRRTVRDSVDDNFGGRLYRHLPGLAYRGRHDNLFLDGQLLSGWRRVGGELRQVKPEVTVDLELEHRWWSQPESRQEAKHRYYTGPRRAAETASASERADVEAHSNNRQPRAKPRANRERT